MSKAPFGKNMIGWLNIVLLTTTILLGGNYMYTDNNKVYKTVSGTIRNSGNGWEVLSDSAHTPINVKSVVIENGVIKINYTFTAKAVGSLIVTPDETFMKEGYKAGSSVGLTYSYIYIGKEGTTSFVDPNTLVSARGNFWFQGVFEVE